MAKHLQKELEKIKKTILSLGAMVEEIVQRASRIIKTRDALEAENIIKYDHEIDDMEIEIEEECLKLLALYQPVAVDLRFLIAVIKINNDLERIADEAVNIAQRIQIVSKKKNIELNFDYFPMTQKTTSMLKKSLDALVNLDTDLAYKVLFMDDEIDKIHKDSYDVIKEIMIKDSKNVGGLLNFFLISRHLERIADHATNIAEEVIYMTEGEIVRHGKYDKQHNLS